jgi:hypothetical protein
MISSPDVVISTRLPPRVCGVGTYSWLLHKHRADTATPASFFTMDGASESRSFLGLDAITDFSGDPRKLETLLDRAGAAHVLLHYAGRGYQRFGCPIWLPSVLRRWKRKVSRGLLTVFFHEVPAALPKLPHHVVFAKVGAHVIGQLAALADVLVTNTETHASVLRELPGCAEVHCLPVGSNIEPIHEAPRSRLETEFVLFGLPFGRLQTLQAFAPYIGKWHASGVLEKLHAIGPEDPKLRRRAAVLLDRLAPVLVSHGALGERDVSRLLTNARFALTNVTRETWSKSGVFMACAAHGCAAVIMEKESEAPLCYGIARDELGRISASEIESRSAALKDWYERSASWPVTAGALAVLSTRSRQ